MNRRKIPWYAVCVLVILYLTTCARVEAVSNNGQSTSMTNLATYEENNTSTEKSLPSVLPYITQATETVSPERINTTMKLPNKSLLEQNQHNPLNLPPVDLQATMLTLPQVRLVTPVLATLSTTTSAPLGMVELRNVPGPARPALLADHVCGNSGRCEKRSLWLCEIKGFRCQPCRCDEDCFRFGDCCPDKYNFTDFRTSPHPFSCVSSDIKPWANNQLHRHFMVDRCNPGLSSGDKAENCQRPSVETVPVYSPQTKQHYTNRHCALCNDVQDSVAWSVKAACRTILDYSKLRTAEDFLLEAWQNPSCAVFAVPPAESDARECSHDSSMVSECPAEWPDQADVTDCQKYLHPITIDEKVTYRNILCAKCNGIHLGRPLPHICGPIFGAVVLPVPYSNVVYTDFAADSKVSVSRQCNSSQVFDTFQSKCRDLYCPPGKVTQGHICTDLFSSAKTVGYKFYFALIPSSDNGAVIHADSINGIFTQYLTHIDYIGIYAKMSFEQTEISVTFSTPSDLAGDPKLEGLRVFNITVKRRFVVDRNVARSHLGKMLMDFVRQGWSFYNEPQEAFVKFHAQWLNEPIDEEFLTFHQSSVSTTKHLQVTTETRTYRRTPSLVPPLYLKTSSVYLPVNELMDCNLIELSPDEFEAHGENDIIEKATGKVLKTGQYVAVGKAVHVCTNFTGKIVGKHQETASVHRGRVSEAVSSRETSSTTLIVICTGLSLFCTLLSFLCHAFSQRFRTLSSKSNMAFFVNLFCAQLSLLMAIVLPVSGTVCSVLGAIIHYFWLSTLSWGLVSTYIAYKIVNKLYNPNNTSKMLTIFCLLCQCLPCILVAAYISVHVISSQTPGYGLLRVNRDGQVCFLATSVDVIVGFITPIGILLLLSQVFHVRLLCIFPQTNDEVENDTELGRTISKSYCTVLVPLSCTWVFGSLAVILGDSYLWYGFLLFHASTGMFVIYSFIIVAGCFDIRDKRYEQSSCLNGSTEKHVAQPLDTEETVNAYSSHM